MSKYSLLRYRKKTQKLNQIGAPEGTLCDFSSILSQIIEGGALLVKKKFEKKSHNAEKLKGGPFGIFQHPFCRKTPKN